MSKRSYGLLAFATLVALIAAGWTLWSENAARSGSQQSAGMMFPVLSEPGTRVSAMVVEAPEYTLQLERQGDEWVASSRGAYPVKTEQTAALISGIAAMRRLEAKTQKPEWYGWIGVEDSETPGAQSALVRLSSAQGTDIELLVGKVSASLGADPIGGTYVRVPGDAQSWLVSGTVAVPGRLNDWFGDLFSIQGPDIRRITIREDGAVVFDAGKDADAGVYTLQHLDARYERDGFVLDEAQLNRVAQVLVSVSFEDVVAADAVDVRADGRTVSFETNSGLVLTMQLAERDGEPWVVFSAEAEPGSAGAERAAAIASRVEGWAFRLPDQMTLPLLSNVNDLLRPEDEMTAPGNPGQVITDPSVFGGDSGL